MGTDYCCFSSSSSSNSEKVICSTSERFQRLCPQPGSVPGRQRCLLGQVCDRSGHANGTCESSAALGSSKRWLALSMLRTHQRRGSGDLALPVCYLPHPGVLPRYRRQNHRQESLTSCLVRSASRPYLGEVNTRSFVRLYSRSCFCLPPERDI